MHTIVDMLFINTLLALSELTYTSKQCFVLDLIQFNSIQLLYSRLNSIIYIQVVHNNLRSI